MLKPVPYDDRTAFEFQYKAMYSWYAR